MDTFEALMTRKSIRSYVKVPLMDGQVNDLVRAATKAPKTGEFHIAVVTDAAVLAQCDQTALDCMLHSGDEFLMSRAALPGYRPMYGAPLLMMFSGQEQNRYSLANASCAATAVTIAATAMGLGSCFVVTPALALEAKPKLARKMGIPKTFIPQCGVLVGFSGEDHTFDSPEAEFTNISYCR